MHTKITEENVHKLEPGDKLYFGYQFRGTVKILDASSIRFRNLDGATRIITHKALLEYAWYVEFMQTETQQEETNMRKIRVDIYKAANGFNVQFNESKEGSHNYVAKDVKEVNTLITNAITRNFRDSEPPVVVVPQKGFAD